MKAKLRLTKKRLYLLFGLLAVSLLWIIVPLTSTRFSTTMSASESGDIKVTKVTLNQNYDGSTDTSFIAYFGLSKLYGYQTPEREAHEFRGYYAESACTNLVIDEDGHYQPNTTYVDENGKWQYNNKTKVTLYAKWEKLPILDDGDDDVVNAGDKIAFGNTGNWRIIARKGPDYLVIKEQALTNEEVGISENQDVAIVPFQKSEVNTYFVDEINSTGYGESNLKSIIDTYYANYIEPDFAAFVLSVDLDLPNWERHREDINLILSQYISGGSDDDNEHKSFTYNSWSWRSAEWPLYYNDSRFATSLEDIESNDFISSANNVNSYKQQAFALSMGDVRSLDKSTFSGKMDSNHIISIEQSDEGLYTTLLDFNDSEYNSSGYWLRSAGYDFSGAACVSNGYLADHNYVLNALSVRPSMWVTLPSWTVTFNSQGGSTIDPVYVPKDNLGSTGKIAKPSDPTKDDYIIVGWYKDENYQTEFKFDTDTITTDTTLYAKWAEKQKITLNQSEATTQGTASFEIAKGSILPTDLTAPTRTGYNLTGYWTGSSGIKVLNGDMTANTEATAYWNTDGTWKYDNNLTLYPKWEIEEIDFADSRWRVLKKENGNALIIKKQALTVSEATGSGSANDLYKSQFRDGSYYFTNTSGENGYEAGGSSITYLKGAIDYYYNHTIATHATDANRVLIVDLNNPNYTELMSSSNYNGSKDKGITKWSGYSNYYKDTQFVTTVEVMESTTVKKQAFALSYGDINHTMGLNGEATSSSFLAFSDDGTDNKFWLRSASAGADTAPIVYANGSFINNNSTFNNLHLVRPALWIDLCTPWQVAVKKDGAPYSGKTLTLKQASDVKGTATTDIDGIAHFSGVADGTYDLYDGETKLESDVSVTHGETGTALNFWTVSFDTDDGSTAPDEQVIYSGQNATEPTSNPIKDGNAFAGWVTEKGGSEAFNFTNITSKKTAYAKWVKKQTITLNQSEATTQGTASFEIAKGSTLPTDLTAPTRTGYNLTGYWTGSSGVKVLNGDMTANTDATAYWNTDGTWKYDNNLTLYPKWEIEEIDFADSRWRVLKKENGNALIIKKQALTVNEATGNTGDSLHKIRFTADSYYFSGSSGSKNGYETSSSSTSNLKGAIDYYYNHTIATHATDANRVLIVDLNNPNYNVFTGTGFLGTVGTYQTWQWNSDNRYFKDTRFATTVEAIASATAKKQAFALSFGDINLTMGIDDWTKGTSFLAFPDDGDSNTAFWLRSAGYFYSTAGKVNSSSGDFRLYAYFSDSNLLLVRPALWIDLGTPWQVAVKKDGAAYSGKTLTLKQASDVKGTATTDIDGIAHFSGVADGTYDLYDGETRLEENVEVKHGETGTDLNFWTVSFDTDDGSPAPDEQVIYSGQNATEPTSNPIKDGNAFAGWYEKEADELKASAWNFTTDKVTKATKLYAKWTSTSLPITDKNTTPEVIDAGDEVTLANAQWRILKVKDGNKALIIKVNALTKEEATADTGAEVFTTKFRDGSYYFTNSSGANGYEAGDTGNYLKACIDRYYDDYLKDYESKILPVDLDNPTFTKFTSNLPSGFGAITNNTNIGSWSWTSYYYKDTRFVTLLTDDTTNTSEFKQQAFALSYGDINSLPETTTNGACTLINFENVSNHKEYWLRSAGSDYSRAGFIYDYHISSSVVNVERPVRPALWVKLN
ncbi:MAG: InlB B-repeat-containing protein [Streptococcaceae bacterium]|jgi:uncharacterized repeat protein (TIGR02543 family)|nr:InlB B-repeat-containing protein [Streptococcaceae bacterium]MCH4176377.1 InlB B-repeat-containing protein [Streptococcaceae bacterium]